MHSLKDNNLREEGAMHVADALMANSTLTELKYGPSHPKFAINTL